MSHAVHAVAPIVFPTILGPLALGEAAWSAAAPKPPKIPSPTTPSAGTQEAEIEAAAHSQALALQRRRGLASTILTGPLGVGGTAQTQRATLGA